MLAHTRTRHIDGNMDEIILTMPRKQAAIAYSAILRFLELAGHTVEPDERGLSIEESFADIAPSKILRGLRIRENLTQEQFGKELGIAQHNVSEMETDKRTIGIRMAKRIEARFGMPYKAFLS
ncbi:hypothetical protein FACS1894103_7320 [Campylobacterota bacterium]|nr:hypothetical protein FACS1894103_7320 [Campylobacterota bacterium]